MQTAALDDLCELITDGTHYTPPDVGHGFPFLTVKDMNSSGLDFNNCSRITEDEFFKAREQNSAPKFGDILFSKDGTVGKVHVVSEKQEFAVLSSIAILRPNSNLLDSNFAAHYLRSPSALSAATQRKTGSALTRIILRDLKQIHVPILPLEEQKRIAAILHQADDIRRKRQYAIDRLNQLGQAIFHEMFGDLVRNDKNWPQLGTLGDYAEIASGITKGRDAKGKSTRSVPYLAVANVQDKRLKLDPLKEIEATEDEIDRYKLCAGDLLLTEGGDPDKLGRGTLWNEELPECIHQNHVFRVRADLDIIEPIFLNWLVSSSYGKKYFLKSAKQTTGIASINMTQLKAFPMLVPPLGLQRNFAQELKKIDEFNIINALSLVQNDSLFNSLQHRAFAGKL